MAVGIRFLSVSDAVPGHAIPTWCRMRDAWQGNWLREYDPDAHDGIGSAVWTEHAVDALRFESEEAAQAFWRRQSGSGTAPLMQVHIVTDNPDAPVWIIPKF